jgi:hypothetical protein
MGRSACRIRSAQAGNCIGKGGAAVSDTRLIPLTQGKSAIVDAADYDRLAPLKWHAHLKRNRWYVVHSEYQNGKIIKIPMHRLVMDAPKGLQVDHKDGDGLNNSRSNLRLATHQQNQWNRGKYKVSTSGIKGVYWYAKTSKWTAKIRVNGKLINLGYFAQKDVAAQVYAEAAKKYHGEFAHV